MCQVGEDNSISGEITNVESRYGKKPPPSAMNAAPLG
jgi:hypothetical protein